MIWAMSIGRVSSRKKGMGSSMFDKSQILLNRDCIKYGPQVSVAGDYNR